MGPAERGDGAGNAPATSPRLLVVTAPWCAECRRMAPLIEKAASEHPAVMVEHLDVSTDPDTAKQLDIMGTPTLIGYSGDREVGRIVGRRGPEALDRLFDGIATGAPIAAGHTPQEAGLRLIAGLAMLGIGLVSGPAWPILAIGAVIAGYGVYGLFRHPNQ